MHVEMEETVNIYLTSKPKDVNINIVTTKWAISSGGRAPDF
jgi:hypothetical protein